METALYILVFCTSVLCAPHERPYRYTLTRDQCVEQMLETHLAYKSQGVRCESRGEIINNDGKSLSTINIVN